MSEPSWWTKRRARKQHRCDGYCGHPIEPGVEHNYATGVTDGEWWSGRLCLGCTEEMERQEAEGWHYDGVVWERIAEYARDDGRAYVDGRWVEGDTQLEMRP